MAIERARLDERYARIGVLGKAAREHAARGARSDDHIVECRLIIHCRNWPASECR